MFQRLLLAFLLIVGIGILIFRFSGTGGEIERRKQFFSNPFTILFEQTRNLTSSTSTVNKFPFPATPDATGYLGPDVPIDGYDTGDIYPSDPESELMEIEREYDDLAVRIAEAKQFGNPSPYRGLVRIADSYSGTSADQPALEYISLEAHSGNTAPVAVTGWSLQSVSANTRFYIPAGAKNFVMGKVPEVASVWLDPGEDAVVSSGVSPTGVSFKENLCTGYLGQFQTFVPSLGERCPGAEQEVMSEPATTRTADPACVAYARSLSTCRFPFGDPPDVSAYCYAFIRNALTYNGCVERHRWRPSFGGDTWRLFLESPREIWKQGHDVIRLLDREGRIVDVWAY